MDRATGGTHQAAIDDEREASDEIHEEMRMSDTTPPREWTHCNRCQQPLHPFKAHVCDPHRPAPEPFCPKCDRPLISVCLECDKALYAAPPRKEVEIITADAIATARAEALSHTLNEHHSVAIDHFLRALSKTQMIVPREPTEEIINAMERAEYDTKRVLKLGTVEAALWVQVYHAMIAAATPKQGEKG